MPNYINPNLMMTDSAGENIPVVIPDLTTALQVLNKDSIARKQSLGIMLNDAEYEFLNNQTTSLTPTPTPTSTTTSTPTPAPVATAPSVSQFTPDQIAGIKRKQALGIMLNDAEYEAVNTPTLTPAPTPTPTPTPTVKNIPSRIAAILAKQKTGAALNDGELDELTAWQQGSQTTNSNQFPNEEGGTVTVVPGNSFTDDSGGTVTIEGTGDYTTVDGVLRYKGTPYTGTYNGQEYVDGKLKVTPPPGGGDKYETVDGVLNKNGKPYTGTYEGKEYVDGKVKTASPGDKYETVNGVFTKNGQPFDGIYNGKTYKDGKEVITSGAGSTAENAALASVNAQVTALTAQIAQLIKLQTDTAAKAAADAAKPKVVGVRTVRKTGGVVETVEVMSDGSAGKVIDSYKDYGARDSVMRMFQNLGLGTDLINSMVAAIDKVYEENIMPTEDQILNTIYTSDAYNTRFAANKTIRERMASGKGLPGDRVLTPQEYIQTEKTFKQYMESAGLPTDFYNELNDFTNLIANSISPDELKDRVNVAKNVLQNADANTKKALKDYYNLTDADMVAYILDKEKAFRAIDKRFVYSTPDVQKMYTASEVGGAAGRAKLNATKAFAEEITIAGKAGQAEEAFQTTARNQQDYSRLMGLYDEKAGEEDLTRQQLSLAGGTEVALKTKRLASKERAKFQTRSAIDRASLTRRLNNPDV